MSIITHSDILKQSVGFLWQIQEHFTLNHVNVRKINLYMSMYCESLKIKVSDLR